MPSDYRVELDVYNGPLDLLLYLIKRDELDIYDIPIARITDTYMQYVQMLKGMRDAEGLDINVAGDFLVMAATLMEIKSAMLLPKPPPAEGQDSVAAELADPRYELVQQLLEYKRLKDAAMALDERQRVHSQRFARYPAMRDAAGDEPPPVDLDEVQVWDLLDAFSRLMREVGMRQPRLHEVVYDDTPIDLHAADIEDRLGREGSLTLRDLLVGRSSRSEMIGVFLALLELIREKKVIVHQMEAYAELLIELASAEHRAAAVPLHLADDVASPPVIPTVSAPQETTEDTGDRPMPHRESSTPLRPTTLGLAPSFGFGDRLGLATPGHVAAMRQSGGGIQPIFPQQSIREMTRTRRTPQQVMREALDGAMAAGWNGVTGADADHLKTEQDIDATAAAGFVFFTIDPSAEVDFQADGYSPDTLDAKYRAVADEVGWIDEYRGKVVRLATGTNIELGEQVCLRAAVKYGRAINLALRLAKHIQSVSAAAGRDHEIELSVDETPQPTALAEHYIIADQCLRAGMKLVSLAPRFIGDFEKGVDYKGDLAAFEKSLADHAAIAAMLGPYKLSLHSGSDKLSVYTLLSRLTRGRFHVKTAGTSYLEALRVVARHDSTLFRRIVDFARSRYDEDKATYHVSATVGGVPAPSAVSDDRELERLYLGSWMVAPPGTGLSDPGRQILHCTFGSVLTSDAYGPALRDVIQRHGDTYVEVLALHFGKHLDALRKGL